VYGEARVVIDDIPVVYSIVESRKYVVMCKVCVL
jgi:hypothetical protein